jgi:hypothetical protein
MKPLMLLFLAIISYGTAHAQTPSGNIAARIADSLAGANPIDAFYPVPGAMVFRPNEADAAAADQHAAQPAAQGAFTIHISNAPGCDSTCKKLHLSTAALPKRRR